MPLFLHLCIEGQLRTVLLSEEYTRSLLASHDVILYLKRLTYGQPGGMHTQPGQGWPGQPLGLLLLACLSGNPPHHPLLHSALIPRCKQD